jgi:tetratricopeptide (TPR) repeat protein
MKNICATVLFALTVLSICVTQYPAYAQTPGPQETLSSYVSDLRKNPNDYTLREKIIKLAAEIKPAPELPKEAVRFMARGAAAVRDAKEAADFREAVTEFEKATLAAPWFANAYYNLGVSQDKAGMYAEAVRSLKLYLLAAPGAADAGKVEGLTYEIEYRQEKAAKASSPEAIAAKKQEEERAWLARIDGARYVCDRSNPHISQQGAFEIHGSKVYGSMIVTWCSESEKERNWTCNPGMFLGRGWQPTNKEPYEISGHEFSWEQMPGSANTRIVSTISDDGTTITTHLRNEDVIYRRVN